MSTPAAAASRNITTAEKLVMQQKLKDLGLYADIVDGRWGANSIIAMSAWQQSKGYSPADGLPTYTQMVALGATVPEVLPRPRSSMPGSILGLLLKAVPFFFKLLPKVNLPMNNAVLLALGRINKAWVAAVVSFIATNVLAYFWGINVTVDTQALIVTIAWTVVSGLLVWLVPNVKPASEPVAPANFVSLYGTDTRHYEPVSKPLDAEQAFTQNGEAKAAATVVDADGTRTTGV